MRERVHAEIHQDGIVNERSYIRRLIAEGEHQQQDFKYKIADAPKLAKSVSAFANTDGGRLLIGVRDDGVIAGVKSEEEIFMMHAAAYTYCRPQPSIHFDTYVVDGRTVVVATVPPSTLRPIFALSAKEGAEGPLPEKKAYVRIADKNIVASPVHLRMWREQVARQPIVTNYAEDHTLLVGILKGRGPLTLNQLTRLSRLSRNRVVALLARLIRYDIAGWKHENQQFVFFLL